MLYVVVMLTGVNVSVILALLMVRDNVFSPKGFDVEEVKDIIAQMLHFTMHFNVFIHFIHNNALVMCSHSC